MDVNQLLQDVIPFIEKAPVIRAIFGAIIVFLLFGMKITGANSLITILVITVIALGIYFLRRFRYRQSGVSYGD